MKRPRRGKGKPACLAFRPQREGFGGESTRNPRASLTLRAE
jgi:hypothetical protein